MIILINKFNFLNYQKNILFIDLSLEILKSIRRLKLKFDHDYIFFVDLKREYKDHFNIFNFSLFIPHINKNNFKFFNPGNEKFDLFFNLNLFGTL